MSVQYLFLILLLIIPDILSAHARIRPANADGSIPQFISRNGKDNNKGGDAQAVPCGPNSQRSQNPVVLVVGDPIVIPFEETIDHTGSFLLNFSEDGETWVNLETITDPQGNVNGAAAQFSFGVDTPITTPNVPGCTECMLQFVQDMNGAPYKSCVDIVITSADNPPPAQPSGFAVSK